MSVRRLMSVAVGAVLALGACASDPTRGYAFASEQRRGVTTVSVPAAVNETEQAGLSPDVTRAVIHAVRASPAYRVVQGDAGQTVLNIRIVRLERRPLSTSRAIGLVQEMAVRIVVSFELVDRATGEVLVSRQNFDGLGTFVPDRLAGERMQVGVEGAIDDLARGIAAQLRGAW